MRKIAEEAYTRAKDILIANRPKLEQLAEQLLQKEVIFREDLEAIFGKRPYEEHQEFDNNMDASTPKLETTTLISEAEIVIPAEVSNGEEQGKDPDDKKAE